MIVFIGATATRKMLYFDVGCFRQLFYICSAFHNLLGNHALWLAFITYLSLRGIVQTFIGREIVKKAI